MFGPRTNPRKDHTKNSLVNALNHITQSYMNARIISKTKKYQKSLLGGHLENRCFTLNILGEFSPWIGPERTELFCMPDNEKKLLDDCFE